MIGTDVTNTVSLSSDRDAMATAQILARHVAYRRQVQLAALRDELATQHINAILVTRHRLVLRGKGPCDPSGLTDPQLYVFTSHGQDVATTDGRTYHFSSGQTHPAGDPAGAASLLAAAG